MDLRVVSAPAAGVKRRDTSADVTRPAVPWCRADPNGSGRGVAPGLCVHVCVCLFAAHVQQVWHLEQQQGVSIVAVQNLQRAPGGEEQSGSGPSSDTRTEALCHRLALNYISPSTDLENRLPRLPLSTQNEQ